MNPQDDSRAGNSATLVIREPATGNTIEEVAVSTPQEVQQAVARSRLAQISWAELPVKTRTQWLLDWRNAILAAGDRLAPLIARENGKPIHEAWLHEIVPLCDTLGWLANNAGRILADSEPHLRWMKHQRSLLWARPRGIAAVISPYNMPLLIPFADAAAALTAGCSVIVKPSELTPLVAREAAQLACTSGLPTGLLQVLIGGPNVARQLIASNIQEVMFTGSRPHGCEIARQCADHLVPCTLELGGCAAAIVLDDADVERTAAAIVFGALANSGQNCIAVERVFVASGVGPRLVSSIVERVVNLRQGNPILSEVDLGALTSPQQLVAVMHQVSAAVADGAQVLTGGDRGLPEGNYYSPTVLQNCQPQMAIVSEETFGPVVPIVTVNSLEEAIVLVNRGTPSLAGYLFGGNDELLLRAARSVNASHVLINDVLWSYVCPEIPFGGLSHNGWGVTHGSQGLLSHTSSVHLGRMRIRLPEAFGMGFPYAKNTRNFVQRALKFFIR